MKAAHAARRKRRPGGGPAHREGIAVSQNEPLASIAIEKPYLSDPGLMADFNRSLPDPFNAPPL